MKKITRYREMHTMFDDPTGESAVAVSQDEPANGVAEAATQE